MRKIYSILHSSMAILNMCAVPLLLCSFLLLSGYRHVDGFQEDISLTRAEELEIENELQRLNKPAVKTVKTSYGDLYDCVDFYKQPAFDNPLLKNHAYHPGMRPSGHRSASKRIRGNTRSKHGQVKFNRVDCPFGTVPIRRVTKEELVRTKLNKRVLETTETDVQYAVVRTKFDDNTKYKGGSAFITIFNLTIEDPRQYSLSRMSVHSGTNTIQVGTQTNPAIYNNLDTHIFVRTKTSDKDEFNLRGNSFVQVIYDLPVDMRVTNVSQRGIQSVNARFAIDREDETGNWWFYLDADSDMMTIGFWPPASFPGSVPGLATGLDWGGEVSGPTDVLPAPMGSGKCPRRDTKYDAYCLLIKVINEEQQDVDDVDTERFKENPYYNVIDEGIVSLNDGHLMFFGGPDRINECTR